MMVTFLNMNLNRLHLFTLSCFIFLVTSNISVAQEDWTLNSNEDQIKVYLKDHPTSNIKMYRAVTILPADLQTVYDMIMDGNNLYKWNYNVKESRTLVDLDSITRVIYLYHKFPWPVKNRYNLSHINTIRYDDGSVRMVITPDETQDFTCWDPEAVKMTDYKGYWLLKPTENGTQVTQELWGDPAGNLPTWAINSRLDGNARHTFKEMRIYLNGMLENTDPP